MNQPASGTKKEYIRAAANQDGENHANSPVRGRLAEIIRRQDSYRTATAIFITPEPLLLQARINCLQDGKTLLMPGPGLKDDFFLLEGKTIPFVKRLVAVTPQGLAEFGRPMPLAALAGFAINLLLTTAVAIDQQGNRLGDGNGFFDLSYAILAAAEALAIPHSILAVIDSNNLRQDTLPRDPWDIRMHGTVTPAGVITHNTTPETPPRIYWQALPEKRIRKIKPLWQMYRQAESRSSGVASADPPESSRIKT